MNAKSRAQGQLELYQRYSGIACEVTNSDIRLAYEGLARQALLCAAKLDPGAVSKTREITIPISARGPTHLPVETMPAMRTTD
jgi:hypothetical protein